MKASLHACLLAFAATFACSLAAAADQATIKLRHDSHTETLQVPLSTLAIGESRQLATESGQPAIVTRHADGLDVETAGRVIHVPLVAAGAIEGRRMLKLHTAEDGSEPAKKVIVKHGAHTLDADGDIDVDALLADIEHDLGDGERTIIIRRRAPAAD